MSLPLLFPMPRSRADRLRSGFVRDIQDGTGWIQQSCARCRTLIVVPRADPCSYVCRTCAAQESLCGWVDFDLLYDSDSDDDDACVNSCSE